jgi:UDP-2,4-diacetamido-2,4,6-trideoxy-beta-L-altropyranose hydrolase
LNSHIIAIRTTASSEVGLGHLQRCLTLAEEIRIEGGSVRFLITRNSVAMNLVLKHDFPVFEVQEEDDIALEQTAHCLRLWRASAVLVDSYSIDFERVADLDVPVTAVIDDSIGRRFRGDLLINGAPGIDERHSYELEGAEFLLGARYTLLRREFRNPVQREIRHDVKRILLVVGGMDSTTVMPLLIKWTKRTLNEASLDVIIGPFFSPEMEQEIRNLALADASISIHYDPPNLRELMLNCDLAICGGGQTTFELAATGTPAIAICLFENQWINLKALASRGTLLIAGRREDPSLEETITTALANLSSTPSWRMQMSEAGRSLLDGAGAARAARRILELCDTKTMSSQAH